MHLADPRSFAESLTAALVRRSGGSLRASYLHGSLALGGWTAERSDVDLLFVAADDISDEAVSAISDELLAHAGRCPGKGLECSLVAVSPVATPSPPYPFLLHSGPGAAGQRLHIGSEVPGDDDLLMHYAVCRAAGIALLGPAPQDLIGVVPRPVVLSYLASELDWGLANAPESYAVLNACRALEYLGSGHITSKVAGGTAALERGTGPAGLVRQALDQQQGKAGLRPPGPEAIAFVRSVIARLATATATVPGS